MKRNERYFQFIWGLVGILGFATSCSNFLGSLRPSNDDQEGMERRADNESDDWRAGASASSYERNPASIAKLEAEGRNLGDELDARRRDLYRTLNSDIAAARNLKRVTKEDFVDQSQEEGSLWASSGQTNYYFTKNKVRSAGDIVTVVVEDDLFKRIGSSVKANLSPYEKANEVAALQEEMRKKYAGESDPLGAKDNLTASAAAAQRTPNVPATTASPTANTAATAGRTQGVNPEDAEKLASRLGLEDVDVLPSLEIKSGEKLMGQIIERYPNGNYRVRASKSVLYKKGPPRQITVVGLVKGTDITEDTDLITSGKMYESRIEATH